jgi:hypothetical protein
MALTTQTVKFLLVIFAVFLWFFMKISCCFICLVHPVQNDFCVSNFVKIGQAV